MRLIAAATACCSSLNCQLMPCSSLLLLSSLALLLLRRLRLLVLLPLLSARLVLLLLSAPSLLVLRVLSESASTELLSALLLLLGLAVVPCWGDDKLQGSSVTRCCCGLLCSSEAGIMPSLAVCCTNCSRACASWWSLSDLLEACLSVCSSSCFGPACCAGVRSVGRLLRLPVCSVADETVA